VLIAEHNLHQVSERDLQGKILWKRQVQQPVACQRLANGNTFIGARSQLLEIDPNENQVFNYNHLNGDIVCAARTRDGHYVFVTMQGQYVRIDASGKEVKSFQLATRMTYYATIQLLPNNRFRFQWQDRLGAGHSRQRHPLEGEAALVNQGKLVVDVSWKFH
jgi:hypothetical protein